MRFVKCLSASMLLILLSVAASLAQDPGWPRQRVENGNTLVTYQPQVDDWKDFKSLDWRMAFSLTPAGGKQAVGVAEMHAETTVDTDSKMVLINNIKIKKTHFPSLDQARAAQMDQLLRTFLPPFVTITLHQLVASVPKKEAAPAVQLNHDPPVIFVSSAPAILLDVEGQPVSVPVHNTSLEYVLNTRWRLFMDKKKSEYYLLVGEQWLRADALAGPWSAAKKLPKDMETWSRSRSGRT